MVKNSTIVIIILTCFTISDLNCQSLSLSLSSLRLYSNIMMDNDSVYYDYVEYELPVLSVSDDNIYEMFESIVANTTNCEEDSKSFDIEKIS